MSKEIDLYAFDMKSLDEKKAYELLYHLTRRTHEYIVDFLKNYLDNYYSLETKVDNDIFFKEFQEYSKTKSGEKLIVALKSILDEASNTL